MWAVTLQAPPRTEEWMITFFALMMFPHRAVGERIRGLKKRSCRRHSDQNLTLCIRKCVNSRERTFSVARIFCSTQIYLHRILTVKKHKKIFSINLVTVVGGGSHSNVNTVGHRGNNPSHSILASYTYNSSTLRLNASLNHSIIIRFRCSNYIRL